MILLMNFFNEFFFLIFRNNKKLLYFIHFNLVCKVCDFLEIVKLYGIRVKLGV